MHRTPESLFRSVRRLQIALAALTFVCAVLVTAAFRQQAPTVIRARGIIIEDIAGRARILIGSPVPASPERLRTDTSRVRRNSGPRFPATYMQWYRGYQHGTNGIVLLDSLGIDRLVLGDPVPDPNIGRRIGASTGLVINDAAGFERTGYGILTVNGKDRVVPGLDRPNGEAVGFVVDDAGRAGMFAQDRTRNAWFGTIPGDSNANPFFGVMIRDGASILSRLGTDAARR